MRKTKLLMAALFATVLACSAFAEDKEVTVTGDGQCAKCSLNETKKCQNAIKTSDGKTYYLADNKVSKDFHDEVCKETKKVTATGTVKEVDGKMQLTASKIELAK
jgi:RecG-like helicase